MSAIDLSTVEAKAGRSPGICDQLGLNSLKKKYMTMYFDSDDVTMMGKVTSKLYM